MTRQDKLYDRLSELESEWENFIVSELEKLSNHEESTYITRYMGHYTAKEYSDEETRKFERVEKEVNKLRGKLGLSINVGPRKLLDRFEKNYKNGKGNAAGVSNRILKELHKIA